MFRKFLGMILLLTPFSLSTCSVKKDSQVHISMIYDGDTFADNKNQKYRLFGIDTPELNDQFHSFQPTKGIRWFYGQKAKIYVSNLILNHIVKIKTINKDKFGRFIVQIFYDNKDLAVELLKRGLAKIAYFNVTNTKNPYYSTEFEYFQKLTNVQKLAADQQKGIWANLYYFKKIFPH